MGSDFSQIDKVFILQNNRSDKFKAVLNLYHHLDFVTGQTVTNGIHNNVIKERCFTRLFFRLTFVEVYKCGKNIIFFE